MPSAMEVLRKHRRVEMVDDERSIGNGVIVTLKEGWTFTPGQDHRVQGEDATTLALQAVRGAYHFGGPYTD